MKAVVVGEKSDTLDKLSSVLVAGGIGVHAVESPHQFFRRLDEFRAAPIIVQWPLGEISGEAVVRRMRELFRAAAPIVVVGPLADPRDTVAALHVVGAGVQGGHGQPARPAAGPHARGDAPLRDAARRVAGRARG